MRLPLAFYFILSTTIFSCTRNSPEASHTLWVKNMSGQKELIANFYQKTEGKEDCESVKMSWQKKYESWCESH